MSLNSKSKPPVQQQQSAPFDPFTQGNQQPAQSNDPFSQGNDPNDPFAPGNDPFGTGNRNAAAQ
jgi:hypothetical protein